ncbi:unnamed protein product [Ciceribacter selenitireducens ATCC BAA-1503]|uniref:Uncharacterized protein n=1 Tax=Ciceribacter selenitireducens ATCC BAA-1503 TaxID=1336235 RepID=A0A376A8X3_9HYPH|nr:unnamed protein product [Ciceribacter selenitireducens ATCC BAA-1503]
MARRFPAEADHWRATKHLAGEKCKGLGAASGRPAPRLPFAQRATARKSF